MGEKIFYARVSTEEQNEQRQIEIAINQYGVSKDNVYIDKASGKNMDRPQFKKMMDYIRKNDVVIVESISRISRNIKDLLQIIDTLNEKCVTFISQKENINTETAQGKFMLTVFGAMAELERESILERQREGIAIAKEKGLYKGRKPMQIDKVKFDKMVKEWQKKERTAVSIMREFNITQTTFYKWVKAYEK